MAKFFNPYHFVPLRKPATVKEDRVARHDIYLPDTHSGRITCSLTTRTSTIVGSEQSKNTEPTQVKPYRLDNDEIAVPASSIRGMISAIAEAASNSAPRVLGNGILSYRKKMTDNPLSAIGMVLTNGVTAALIPLTLPTLRPEHRGRLPEEFRGLYKQWALRVYLSDREVNSFQLDPRSDNRVYGMRLGRDLALPDGSREGATQSIHERAGYVLAQKPLDGNLEPIPWEDIPQPDRKDFTPGILRVLGSVGRDLPSTRKHELFIPIPEASVVGNRLDPLKLGLTPIEIPTDILGRFHDLANERVQQCASDEPLLPYVPHNTRDPKKVRSEGFRLQTGDLVFFRPSPQRPNNRAVVAELSFSSIWRDCVKNDGKPATIWDFFQNRDDDLVPLHRLPGAKPRTGITPAELLFGYVEQLPKGSKDKSAKALASRLRFSAARLEKPLKDHEILEQRNGKTWRPILKILGTPKPPSPALYFRKNAGSNAHIQKSALNLAEHQPQGRKFYLHSDPTRIETQIPTTVGDYKDNLKQKLQVELIKPGIEFHFHIDFDNLTDTEFGLLLYSLKPSATFHHKLGLAKSLGLGSIKVEISDVQIVDRRQRYTAQGFDSPRYRSLSPGDWNKQLDAYRKRVDKAVHRALEIIGDPASTKGVPVHAPLQNWQVDGDPKDREDRTFSWFVANDFEKNPQRQALQPLDGPHPDQIRLTPLETNGDNKRPRLRK